MDRERAANAAVSARIPKSIISRVWSVSNQDVNPNPLRNNVAARDGPQIARECWLIYASFVIHEAR
jgi:hypothetical protein